MTPLARRITSVLVAGGMCLAPATAFAAPAPTAAQQQVAPAAVTFTDIDASPDFSTEIAWMGEQRISTGWPVPAGHEYRPFENVTRDAMAAFLYRYAGEPAFTAPTTPTFTDVKTDNRFYKEIEWLAAEGISKGWDTARGREFRPTTDINRDAMAAFVMRFAKGSAVDHNTFSDVAGNEHEGAISWMQAEHLSNGWTVGGHVEYRPLAPIKRDAMAAFMYRLAHAHQVAPTRPQVTEPPLATQATPQPTAQSTPALAAPAAPSVDTTALEQAIADAQALDGKDNHYTSQSWQARTAALTEARKALTGDTATQAEIDAAAQALTNALDHLVPVAPTKPQIATPPLKSSAQVPPLLANLVPPLRVDGTAPVITGADDVTIDQGAAFDPMAGVTATDDTDGDVTGDVTFTGAVVTQRVGDVTLTYTVTDAAGNAATATRTVTVRDSVDPVLSGVDDVTVDQGAAFDLMAGVTATDNVDGDLTADVKVTGTVDTHTIGDVTLTYTVTDAAGNAATATRTVTVKAAAAPAQPAPAPTQPAPAPSQPAPASTQPAPAQPASTDIDWSQYANAGRGTDKQERDAWAMLDAFNAARADYAATNGQACPAVQLDYRLSAVARREANDLAERYRGQTGTQDRLSVHTGNDGSQAYERIGEAGMVSANLAEVAASGQPNAQAAIDGMMAERNKPAWTTRADAMNHIGDFGHYLAITDCTVTRIGVGLSDYVSPGAAGGWWVVEIAGPNDGDRTNPAAQRPADPAFLDTQRPAAVTHHGPVPLTPEVVALRDAIWGLFHGTTTPEQVFAAKNAVNAAGGDTVHGMVDFTHEGNPAVVTFGDQYEWKVVDVVSADGVHIDSMNLGGAPDGEVLPTP